MEKPKPNWHKSLIDKLLELGLIEKDESCQLTMKVNAGSFVFVNKAANLKIDKTIE